MAVDDNGYAGFDGLQMKNRPWGLQLLLLIGAGMLAVLQVAPIHRSSVGSGEWYWELFKFVVPAGLAVSALIGLFRTIFRDRRTDPDNPSD